MTGRRAFLAGAVILLAGAAQHVAEPSGYRMDNYQAPTPATLHGAIVLGTDAVHAIWQKHQAAFVDVLPQPPRPPNLPASTIWHPRPRSDIPGSIWLPDTGYGALAPVMETYFQNGLMLASGKNLDRTLVFYCQANCWMSWNAARRAITLGYRHVAWYPEGTDGWRVHGYPLEPRQPEPRPNVTE